MASCTLLLYWLLETLNRISIRTVTCGDGADAGTRTRNLPITSRVRCQLRHAGGCPVILRQPVRSDHPDNFPPQSGEADVGCAPGRGLPEPRDGAHTPSDQGLGTPRRQRLR